MNFAYDSSGRRTDTWFATNSGNSSWAAHTHVTYDTSGGVQEQATYESNATTASFDTVYCRVVSTAGSACTPSAGNDRSQIQWTENKLTAVTTSYGYDANGRLHTAVTSGSGGVTYTYGYDVRGNMLTDSNGSSTRTLTYNAGDQITTAGYTYDGAGNLTASPTLGTATYNAAGQMTAVTNPGGGAGTYDCENARETVTIDTATFGVAGGLAGVSDVAASAVSGAGLGYDLGELL